MYGHLQGEPGLVLDLLKRGPLLPRVIFGDDLLQFREDEEVPDLRERGRDERVDQTLRKRHRMSEI